VVLLWSSTTVGYLHSHPPSLVSVFAALQFLFCLEGWVEDAEEEDEEQDLK